MAATFPFHPYHGQKHTVDGNNSTYVFDKTRLSWIFDSAASINSTNIARVYVGPTAPSVDSSDTGVLWVDDNGYFTYVWNGSQWIGLTTSTGEKAQAYVSPNPPDELSAGTLWYDSNSGDLRIRYMDEDSSQWVAISTNSYANISQQIFSIESVLGDIGTRLASVESQVGDEYIIQPES